ncbi:MAG: CpaD family pilus assembly lipoprotein [Holosporaceae bacterium]|jgi:type IV pilus biogenesis protein CpaD/CtpE|nr:CpaD family pilus assembly lipoprotein [Holosporaceae bacterium]
MMKAQYWVAFLVINLWLNGCEKQYLPNDGYVPEVMQIDAQEVRDSHFLNCLPNFDFDTHNLKAVDKLLSDIRSAGMDNIEFMLVSPQSVPVEKQEKVKKQLYELMHKRGFINSRIIDYGICIYEGAKIGIKIDVLKCDVKEPDCSKWSEYIGDTDTNKNLPKYGAASVHNTITMIADKTDLVSPRKYVGHEARAAMAATGTSNRGGS